MSMVSRPFLTGEWRSLAILNYAVDPAILLPHVPEGTDLDLWNGQALVSLVGFLFKKTRVRRIPIPGHRTFEEVNLRFYVRRRNAVEWRAGVTFVREIVPRHAVAWVARAFYNEPYMALPMDHRIEVNRETAVEDLAVVYSWDVGESHQRLAMRVDTDLIPVKDGTIEAFITERHWGYTTQRDRSTIEYRVNHARWRTGNARDSELVCDIHRTFGEEFVPFLSVRPVTAFYAEGSPIEVYRGTPISAGI